MLAGHGGGTFLQAQPFCDFTAPRSTEQVPGQSELPIKQTNKEKCSPISFSSLES